MTEEEMLVDLIAHEYLDDPKKFAADEFVDDNFNQQAVLDEFERLDAEEAEAAAVATDVTASLANPDDWETLTPTP